MSKLKKLYLSLVAVFLFAFPLEAKEGYIYQVGKLKARDSQLKVKVGQMAPDFSLPSIAGNKVRLSSFRGKKNVLISFVPAAWTPVCSDQWPGYNLTKFIFDKYDTVILGISVDNIPTLYAWTKEMGGLWFPVLSDFWPHGAVANKFGVLRTDGVSERALILIDKKGIIRWIYVEDINQRPPLEAIEKALAQLK